MEISTTSTTPESPSPSTTSISSPSLPSNSTPSFRFNDLPRELREQVLSWTPLIHRFQRIDRQSPSYQPQGILIRNGKMHHPCTPLLRISHAFSSVAKYILFTSGNRFILSGDPAASTAWLLRQPEYLLRRIHKLDFLLDWADLFGDAVPGEDKPNSLSRAKGPPESVAKAWELLVSTVTRISDIPKLHLSVDAAFLNYEFRANEPVDYDVMPYYEQKFEPFVKNRKTLSRLASFHLLLPLGRELERHFEQMVKGDKYESVEGPDGIRKVPYYDRDPRLPHGFGEWEFPWWLNCDTLEDMYEVIGYRQLDFMADILNPYGMVDLCSDLKGDELFL